MNENHCLSIPTQGGKEIINPNMPVIDGPMTDVVDTNEKPEMKYKILVTSN